MAPRIVDSSAFTVMGCAVDWAAQAGAVKGRPTDEIAKERGLQGATVLQLRWAFRADLGYPLEPFTVWMRQRDGRGDEVPFTVVEIAGLPTVILGRACSEVTLVIEVGPGGAAAAFTGMPLGSRLVDLESVAPGTTQVVLSGPEVRSVVVPVGTLVVGVIGVPTDVADDPAWVRVELVGLPGDGRTASGTDLTADQGFVAAPTDPVSAALDRYRRGAPFNGWHPELDPGVAAPAWVLADPTAMVKLFHREMLDDFVDMVDSVSPPDQQAREYTRSLPTGTGRTATATFNPLRTLVYGALTDPLAALVTGFGTAFDAGWLQQNLAGPVVATHAVNTRRGLDIMVTSTWLDAAGDKVERAALLLGAHGLSLPPTAPTGLVAVPQGSEPPGPLDGPFRAVVSLAWTQPAPMLPFHMGSHALARRSTAPAGSADLLLGRRPDDVAYQPLGDSYDPATPTRRAASDTTYEIDAATTPNAVRYSVANQDLFGRWSPWAGASCTVAEPAAGKATLIGARLDTTVVPGPCPATYTVDVAWSWASRSPASLELVGRLHQQVWAQDPPADLSVPPSPGALRTLGQGRLVRVEFAPDGRITGLATGPGLTATVDHLTADGRDVTPVVSGARGPRRYRVVVRGFELDFTTSARWGLSVWARGVEARPPFREGPWPSAPVVASAADPRPPVITTLHEDVRLTSLRDANGEHHAELTWGAMGGATAYRVYTTSEATFRAHHGMPEPSPSQTLAARLVELRARFAADPDRRPFTRVGAGTVSGTSAPVTLPRGTKDIHLFLVLGVSGGEVESAWPTAADPLCGRRFEAFAAPQTVAPGPPELEVVRVGPAGAPPHAYAASVRVRSAAGARVSRIDLHRVRVPAAATELDTMGPPIASITGSAAGFTVTPVAASGTGASAVGTAQPLGVATGLDPVPGSWRPVFYRAVAWGADDAARGQYGVRSMPSVLRQVVVPPADAPPLSTLSWVAPVAGQAQVRVDTSTTAPVARTVLGPHRVEAEVLAVATDGSRSPVVLTPAAGDLDALPTTAPGAGASGLWLDPSGPSGTPIHLLVRRADVTTELSVRVRLTDPLGRLTEQVLTVPAGSAVVAPDIVDARLDVVTGGWVLSFLTSVPDAVDGVGPYVLSAVLRPSSGVRRLVRVTSDLADIPVARRDEDLFADATQLLPLRRTPRARGQLDPVGRDVAAR